MLHVNALRNNYPKDVEKARVQLSHSTHKLMAVSRVLLARTQPNPDALIKEHRTSQNALNCDH